MAQYAATSGHDSFFGKVSATPLGVPEYEARCRVPPWMLAFVGMTIPVRCAALPETGTEGQKSNLPAISAWEKLANQPAENPE